MIINIDITDDRSHLLSSLNLLQGPSETHGLVEKVQCQTGGKAKFGTCDPLRPKLLQSKWPQRWDGCFSLEFRKKILNSMSNRAGPDISIRGFMASMFRIMAGETSTRTVRDRSDRPVVMLCNNMAGLWLQRPARVTWVAYPFPPSVTKRFRFVTAEECTVAVLHGHGWPRKQTCQGPNTCLHGTYYELTPVELALGVLAVGVAWELNSALWETMARVAKS